MGIEELKELQVKMAKRIVLEDHWERLDLVGGVDVSYTNKKACLVLVNKSMEVVKTLECRAEPSFPYIPGFFSFREGPIILNCLKLLGYKPDLLFVEGHGIAHPRMLGLASWVGLTANIPTIGIAKSRLVGDYDNPNEGEANPLILGKQVGWVYKPDRKKPIFISPGHLVSIKSSLKLTRRFMKNHRLPEPLHLADKCTKSLFNQKTKN